MQKLTKVVTEEIKDTGVKATLAVLHRSLLGG